MDKDSIIKKLRNFLQNTPKFDRECEVVYLLAETRKIIEDNKKENKTLRFYCNWVLHSELNQKSTKNFLSEQFNNCIDLDKNKHEIQKELINRQKDFFMLKDFKFELREFLRNHELPMNFLEGNKWYKFCKLFLNNVMECQIDVGAGAKSCKIRKLSIEKPNQGYYYLFYLSNGMRIDRIKLKFKEKKQRTS